MALVAAVASAGAVHAETLRCDGGLVSEGDSRVSLLYKCGEPLLKDSFCAPVVYASTLEPVPTGVATAVLPCQPMEEWLYDRGAGNLMAKVRLRAGVIQAILYARDPK